MAVLRQTAVLPAGRLSPTMAETQRQCSDGQLHLGHLFGLGLEGEQLSSLRLWSCLCSGYLHRYEYPSFYRILLESDSLGQAAAPLIMR